MKKPKKKLDLEDLFGESIRKTTSDFVYDDCLIENLWRLTCELL
jgi:hypothetical protein